MDFDEVTTVPATGQVNTYQKIHSRSNIQSGEPTVVESCDKHAT
jgi:hypothetical protein